MSDEKNRSALLECRREIDEIDSALIELFEKRMSVAARVAEYKRGSGMPVFDSSREREKLNTVSSLAPEALYGYTRQLFSLLLDISKDHQNKLLGKTTETYRKITEALETTPALFPERVRIACQGIEGANSMSAAEKLFKSPDIEYVKTFEDVIRAVESGYVKYGVLPIENSTAGEVNAVYKLLERHEVYIVRSVRCKIEHSLLAPHGVALSDIREIISHEQAINQCSNFIDGMTNVRAGYAANTAVAARTVSESGRGDIAAISQRACADIYGLNVLERSIQNNDNNYTKFICISKNIEIFPGADKTSLMLVTHNTPGALYKVLSKFFALGINLTELISRPIEGSDFEFRFFMNFDTSVYSEAFASLMQTLDDSLEEFRYLGSYREIV